MIIVGGQARIPLANMAEFRRHAADVVAATRREEGCRLYSFAEDVLEPGLIRIFEIWESREHLQAHVQTPHLAAWRKALGGLGVTDRDVRSYEASGGEPL